MYTFKIRYRLEIKYPLRIVNDVASPDISSVNAKRINNILMAPILWLVCFLSRTADKVCRTLIEPPRGFHERTHVISMNADVYVSGCSIVN